MSPAPAEPTLPRVAIGSATSSSVAASTASDLRGNGGLIQKELAVRLPEFDGRLDVAFRSEVAAGAVAGSPAETVGRRDLPGQVYFELLPTCGGGKFEHGVAVGFCSELGPSASGCALKYGRVTLASAT